MKHRVNLPRRPAKAALTPRQKGALEARHRIEQQKQKLREDHEKREAESRQSAVAKLWRAFKRSCAWLAVGILSAWSGR